MNNTLRGNDKINDDPALIGEILRRWKKNRYPPSKSGCLLSGKHGEQACHRSGCLQGLDHEVPFRHGLWQGYTDRSWIITPQKVLLNSVPSASPGPW